MTFKFLAGISSLVLLFPLIASIARYKTLSKPLRVICLHIFVAAAFEIVSRWLWIHRQNNLFLLHAYTFWELEIISCFYLLLLKHRARWLIMALMIIFGLFSLADAFYMDGLKQFNTLARPVACLIVMCYAIIYLYRQLVENNTLSLMKEPVLLVNTGFLFYFSVSFFLFLLSNYVMEDRSYTHTIWALHTMVAFIFYTTIGWALWKAGKR